MGYKQITCEERHTIDILWNIKKLNITEIGKSLNRSPSTISREIKRNSINGEYFYENAQQKMYVRSRHKYFFTKLKYKEFTKLFLEKYDKRYHGVKATWHWITSNYPDVKHISWVWIYKLIKSRRWVLTPKDRLRKWYKTGGKRTKGIFSKFNHKRVLPLWTRPKSVNLRLNDNDYEGDLIIGLKKKGHAHLLSFTNRKTRVHYLRKVWSKNARYINGQMWSLIKENNLDINTITVDNGLEFEEIGFVGHLANCMIYFCEPYASFQRGTNEHANGLVRRFFPKGTDFSNISEERIKEVENIINNMPREMFDWKSSMEVENNIKNKATNIHMNF